MRNWPAVSNFGQTISGDQLSFPALLLHIENTTHFQALTLL